MTLLVEGVCVGDEAIIIPSNKIPSKMIREEQKIF